MVRQMIFRHVADERLVCLAIGERVLAVELDGAIAGLEQSHQNLDRRAFSGPIRAQQPQHLARAHVKRDVVDRRESTVAFW